MGALRPSCVDAETQFARRFAIMAITSSTRGCSTSILVCNVRLLAMAITVTLSVATLQRFAMSRVKPTWLNDAASLATVSEKSTICRSGGNGGGGGC